MSTALSPPTRRELWLPAIALGLLAALIRAPGLGRWCLAVDEYYSSRAVQFILEGGLPAFPAGGLYSRGPLFHYPAALLSLFLDDAELALRLVPLAAGVLVVPLFYLLARRFLPFGLALGCATALTLSSWQIEFARFGRMYAPMQLVFVATVYFLHRGSFSQGARSRKIAWALACVSLFVHEAALLLVPVFLLAPALEQRQLAPTLQRHSISTALLLLAAYFVLWVDHGAMGVPPPLPPGVEVTVWQSPLVLPRFDLLRGLVAHGALLIPWAGLVAGAVWVSRRAGRLPLVAWLGLHGLLVTFLIQQLGVAMLLIALLGLVDESFRATVWRQRRALLLLFVSAQALWLVVGFVHGPSWLPGAGLDRVLKETLKVSLFYPELVQRTVLPLLRPTPWLAMALYGAVVAGVLRALASSERGAQHLPLLVTLVGMAVVSWIAAPYYESRYFFVLYPLLLLIACIQWLALIRWLGSRGRVVPAPIAVGLPLVLFLLGGDFHGSHVLHVARRDHAFRSGSFERYQRHWYPRADFESPARWVNGMHRPGDAVVVDVVPSVAYLSVPYVDFMRSDSPEFAFTSSRGGRRNRWTDEPLIHDFEDFATLVPADPARSLWLITVTGHFGGSSFSGDDAPEAVARRLGLATELVYQEPDGRIGVWRFGRSRTVPELGDTDSDGRTR